jgi:hypothetical protein
MRRVNPASVKVKAPSRGLVTRWPGETADNLATGTPQFALPGMAARASAVASNVRYEDGVVRCAPGYVRIDLVSPLLLDIIAHWRLDEPSGTRFDATLHHDDLSEVLGVGETIGVGQVSGKFDQAALFTDHVVLIPPTIRVDGNTTAIDLNDTVQFSFFTFTVLCFIVNTGTTPLVVTGVTSDNPNFAPDFTSGTIGVGDTQTVILTQLDSVPPGPEFETGNLTVVSNAVSGRSAIAIIGTSFST